MTKQFLKMVTAIFASLSVILALILLMTGGNESSAESAKRPSLSLGASRLPSNVSQGLPSLSPMLKQVMPAVVNIATVGFQQQRPHFDHPFYRYYRNLPRARTNQSVGSGVIIDAKQGYIVTNSHVVKGAMEIRVTLHDERELEAQLIGRDEETDLALLQVQPDRLISLPIADSDQSEVGDFVVAIGNAFGLKHTVTLGIVSAVGRSGISGGFENLIQTDASINPGNSGGALINTRGELIGINKAIYSKSGGSNGIGFAIPTNMTKTIIKHLIKNGYVPRGLLGINTQDLNVELAAAFGHDTVKGVILTNVYQGSPAAQAGLQRGDIITAINGKAIEDSAGLGLALGLLTVGDTAKITFMREQKLHTVQAEIGYRQQRNTPAGALHPRLRGASISNASNFRNPYLPTEGIVVTDVEPATLAWGIGLRKGDIIIGANGEKTDTITQLQAVLQNNQSKPVLVVRKGRQTFTIQIQ